MSQIPKEKTVLDKNDLSKVIDIQFRQLIRPSSETDTPPLSIDDFFTLYEDIFYQIPKEGDIESHRFILNKTAEHLGIPINEDNYQMLLDEITSLRQELLDSQQIINTISNM